MSFLLFLTMAVDIVSEKAKGNQLDDDFTRERERAALNFTTDYGRPVRKLPSLHGRKSTPTPKFLGTAKAYFVCHISQNFQISLIYAFIGCP